MKHIAPPSLSRLMWEDGVELDKASERRKCEIFNGRGGDTSFAGDISNFNFSPHFVRGLFWLVVSLLVFSIQRLFNSWYEWAHRAPLMPFRICLKGSRPWMPDNKIPPSTWTYKSSCPPLTVVHHRTFSSKPASKGVNEDILRTNKLYSFNYFLCFRK